MRTAGSETAQTPAEPNLETSTQEAIPGLLSLAAAKKARSFEEFAGQPLETYLMQAGIAAHRPPHIHVIRGGAETGQQAAESDAVSARSSVGSIEASSAPVSTTDAFPLCSKTQSAFDALSGLSTASAVPSAPGLLSHKDIALFVKQRLSDQTVALTHPAGSVDTAVSNRIRAQLRALYKDSLNTRKAERIATARAALASMSEEERAKINPFRSDGALPLGAESGSLLNSIQLQGMSTAEHEPLQDSAGGPGGAASVMTARQFEQTAVLRRFGLGPGPVAESISNDEDEPSTWGCGAVLAESSQQEQAPKSAASRFLSAVTSGRWKNSWRLTLRSTDRATHASFKPRRWSLIPVHFFFRLASQDPISALTIEANTHNLRVHACMDYSPLFFFTRYEYDYWVQMSKHKEDRRSSLPAQRVQKRLSNYGALRDRRWSTVVWSSLVPICKVSSHAVAVNFKKTFLWPVMHCNVHTAHFYQPIRKEK